MILKEVATRAIKNFKPEKSAGPDEIYIEITKSDPCETFQYLKKKL